MTLKFFLTMSEAKINLIDKFSSGQSGDKG
jgi:hypothetical protein